MLLLLLSACGLGSAEIRTESASCENWDFGDTGAESELLIDASETRIDITRNGVFQACNSRFTPEIVASGGVIEVKEAWEDSGSQVQCCFSPSVIVLTERGGKVEVNWYAPDGTLAHSEELDTRE